MAHLSPFTAYFDASGHPSDQPFVVVAGYVANYAQWGLFNRAWEHFHGKAGIELPFHMADFEARARTDYKKWPKNDPEAQDFLLNLCTAQQSYTLLHVACIVDMGQYKDINDVFMLQTMLPAYALGARVCVSIIEKWQQEYGINHPVECIFEDGDFGKGKFMDLMRVERMPPPIFKDKKDFPGLQAADHIAWEISNHFKKERAAKQPVSVRESFRRLLAIPHIHLPETLASLLEVCEKKGIKIKKSNIIIPF